MTSAEFILLRYLSEKDVKEIEGEILPSGEGISIAKICEDSYTDAESLCRAAVTLEEQGLLRITRVERDIATDNIVGMRVEVTAKGIAYFD
ncbi:MAG: hypothetical protein ABII88_04595 [Candidatus Omnitrophota bacterium]